MNEKVFLHTNTEINDMCDKIINESAEPTYNFDKYIRMPVESTKKTILDKSDKSIEKESYIPFIPEL